MKPVETSFTEDVKDHQLKILKDDGLYRHLRCQQNGSYIYGFDILTWPGFLAMTGDMGTWVFARTPDMFTFFVGGDDPALRINPGYWSEKLQASDCNGYQDGGAMEYSEEIFKEVVKDRFDNWVAGSQPDDETKAAVWSDIEDDVLSAETEESAHRRAYDFESHGFEFHDFWETRLRAYKRSFIWALYAIVWAIHRYNEAKTPTHSELARQEETE